MRSFIFSLDALLAFLILSSFTKIYYYFTLPPNVMYQYHRALMVLKAESLFFAHASLIGDRNKLWELMNASIPVEFDYNFSTSLYDVYRRSKEAYMFQINITIPVITFTTGRIPPQPFRGTKCGCVSCLSTPCSASFGAYNPPNATIEWARLEVSG